MFSRNRHHRDRASEVAHRVVSPPPGPTGKRLMTRAGAKSEAAWLAPRAVRPDGRVWCSLVRRVARRETIAVNSAAGAPGRPTQPYSASGPCRRRPAPSKLREAPPGPSRPRRSRLAWRARPRHRLSPRDGDQAREVLRAAELSRATSAISVLSALGRARRLAALAPPAIRLLGTDDRRSVAPVSRGLFVRLVLDAIVARKLMPGTAAGHPGFLALGPAATTRRRWPPSSTSSWGSEHRSVVEPFISSPPARSSEGAVRCPACPTFLPQADCVDRWPFVCFDELGEAERDVRREAGAYLHGEPTVRLEGQAITLSPTAMAAVSIRKGARIHFGRSRSHLATLHSAWTRADQGNAPERHAQSLARFHDGATPDRSTWRPSGCRQPRWTTARGPSSTGLGRGFYDVLSGPRAGTGTIVEASRSASSAARLAWGAARRGPRGDCRRSTWPSTCSCSPRPFQDWSTTKAGPWTPPRSATGAIGDRGSGPDRAARRHP